MLTKLSQFQAQGWEKWLSRITFTRGTNCLKSVSNKYKVLPSHNSSKPRLRIWVYLDEALAVLSSGSEYGNFVIALVRVLFCHNPAHASE
jgi:hypothetical protein